MADAPRMKDGGVIPPEWFDNEPSLISEEDLEKAYGDEFRSEMEDYLTELEGSLKDKPVT